MFSESCFFPVSDPFLSGFAGGVFGSRGLEGKKDGGFIFMRRVVTPALSFVSFCVCLSSSSVVLWLIPIYVYSCVVCYVEKLSIFGSDSDLQFIP